VADTNSAPCVERRRPGRPDYTNPHLIVLLRGEQHREDAGTEPERGVAAGGGSPGWDIVLVVLAIMAWAIIGLLIWLVLRLFVARQKALVGAGREGREWRLNDCPCDQHPSCRTGRHVNPCGAGGNVSPSATWVTLPVGVPKTFSSS
jgi:hypothetical protein